jgi:hypothetical protein
MSDNERRNHSGLQPGTDIDMERVGRDLHIPRDEWDNLQVQELAGFIVRVEELWRDLSDAACDVSGETMPPFLDGAHSLYDRYYAAENYLRVILALLKEGLGVWETRQEPGSRNFEYLGEKLANALGEYGLAVVARPETA